ncbi:MAG: hypothetical protein ACRDNS_05940, partial [Trebonia sp.]
WKGQASYYAWWWTGRPTLTPPGLTRPSPAASRPPGMLAFWHGVRVEASDGETAGGWLDQARRLVVGW